MSKLLLIDGNAILHRAFHAYPNFTDTQGNPTNAIYGFFAMLLKLMEDVSPEYLAICFDRGAPTFRMNLYAGYHANRPKMSDDLSPQVPRLQKALEEIGIPLFGVEGYEADDLLGTLSHLATGSKGKKVTSHSRESVEEVIIVTGDRDLLQLVNSHVKILMPLTGITKTALFGAKEVEEKYGIKPSQVIDYKALVGDASDNYPGVTGIGPKTAAGLLQKYESFESLYNHLGDLPPKIGERLAIDAEQAALAKNLATIKLDAPIHLKIEACDVKKFSQEKFVKVFEELGFESLIKRIIKDEGISISDKIKTPTLSKVKRRKTKEDTNSEQLGLL